MKKSLTCLTVLGLIGLIASGACAAPVLSTGARSLSPSASIFTPPAASQVPPAIRQRLVSKLSRAATLNAVMANPAMKSVVTNAAAKAGADASQIAALTMRPLATIRTDIGAGINPDDASYMKLDWVNGLTFSPFSIPSYSGGKYAAGSMLVYSAMIYTPDADIVRLQMPGDHAAGIMSLWLEMPQGPGLYTFVLKLIKTEGGCPADLVGPHDGSNNRRVRASLTYLDSTGASKQTGISFSPLADQSGYVGVLSLDLGACVPAAASLGMRQLNAAMDLNWYPAGAADYFVFGGVTITKI